MKSSKSCCPVCLEQYDSKIHVPYSIKCGHTLCIICLESLKGTKPDVECPKCREPSPFYSKNFALIEEFDEVEFSSDKKETTPVSDAELAFMKNNNSKEPNIKAEKEMAKAISSNANNSNLSNKLQECIECGGKGMNLIEDDGLCAKCRREHVSQALGNSQNNHQALNNFSANNQSQIKECSKCHGRGTQLVGTDGLCSHCRREQARIKLQPVSNEIKKLAFGLQACSKCEGKGINLVGNDGLCAHCRRQNSANNAQNKKIDPKTDECIQCARKGTKITGNDGLCATCRDLLQKYTNVKPSLELQSCSVCGGKGIGLVGDDGLCNHCRRFVVDSPGSNSSRNSKSDIKNTSLMRKSKSSKECTIF